MMRDLVCSLGLFIVVAAATACRPVEGVTYADPNRPEAQDWSQPPSDGPEASLRREHNALQGRSGMCGQGAGVEQALGQLEHAPVPDGVDPITWQLAVFDVKNAVAEVTRAIDEDCAGRASWSLSPANDKLGNALDRLRATREQR